jgi:hypothetical protein
MNELQNRIFALLKQAYSSLGLGDEVLKQHAIMLEQSGMVTADNVETVVNSPAQKSYLEKMQSQLDAVRTSATEKGRKKAEEDYQKKEKERKDAEEAARKKKEADEAAAAAAAEEEKRKKELEGKSEWEKALSDLKAEQAKRDKEWEQKMQGILDANKTSEQTIADLKKQISDRDAAEAARVRMEGITKQAKELGVPQSMIDLGLNIPADWDADKVTNYLTGMANNWKTSHLPNDKQNPLANIGEPKKEDVDAIAAELVR